MSIRDTTIGILALGLLLSMPLDSSAQATPPRGAANDTTPNQSEPRGPVRPTVDASGVPSALNSTNAQEPWTDAWGQEKNFGLAAAETVLANFLPFVVNEALPSRAELLISQISPRSWARGMTTGFGWDDNNFSVNMFSHPYQGNMYFNAARANGYNYWQGLLFAGAGSYMWECCGESHLPSINDWFNTTLGGAAVGELLYRSSSMVLDNTATGSERAWREVGAFLLNPMRGLTRLVSGQSGRVYPNPLDPNDRIPDRLENVMQFGSRLVGEGYLTDGAEASAFLDMELVFGELASLDRQQPFDFFTLGLQLNLSDKQTIGRLQVRGSLWHKAIRDTDRLMSKLLVVQDFDYINTSAYEFGGQSVGLMYLTNRRISDRIRLTTQLYASYMIMGAVNSEYSFAAEIPGLRERLREYDFGSGSGVRAGLSLMRDGHRWIGAEYRGQYLNTLNGSNANGEDAWHAIQNLHVGVSVPLTQSWGVGANADIFWRNSFFDFEDFDNVSVRTPEARIFVTWSPTRGG